MTARLYSLAIGKDFLDPNTTHVDKTAPDIVRALSKFFVIPLAHADYSALPAREKAEWKKKSNYVIGGAFGGKKKAADCQYRSLVTLDLDALTPETAKQSVEALRSTGAHCFVYSTASHTAEKPRLRAIVFLRDNVLPQAYKNLVDYFANLLPPGAVSSESRVLSQIMYKGAHCSDVQPYFKELKGEPFDASKVPDQSPDLTDRPSQCTRSEDVPGIVGRVAARYGSDLDAAILELDLPYRRSSTGATCGEFENRYSFTGGEGADGAVWYSHDQRLWSHHGTDPAREANASIFDLVRLHRFNPAGDDASLPINERASHRAAEAYFLERFPEMAPKVASADEMEVVPAEVPRVADPKRFRVTPIEDFRAGAPQEWHIEGTLPKAALAVIYGASGSGKSFVVFDMVAAIARGIHWRGLETSKSECVYICAEGAQGFRKRIQAYEKHNNVSLAGRMGIISDAPNLLEAADVGDLIAAIKEFGTPKVVAIDTLAAVMPGGNENESAAVGRLIANCNAVGRATGATILLVHHSGKDATKGARGWSGLRAAADAEMEVVREGEARAISVTKSKDDADGKAWGFRLMVVDVGDDLRGRAITSCVVEPCDTSQATGRKVQGRWQARGVQIANAAWEAAGEPVDLATIKAQALEGLTDPKEKDLQRRAIGTLAKRGELAGFLRQEAA